MPGRSGSASPGTTAVTVDVEFLHLVVEGRVSRVTDAERLHVASETMQEVFSWPTEVAGDQLDAEYGAPTSGGPPYQVHELIPVRAYGFPTADQVQPTRWIFGEQRVAGRRA